MSIQTVFKAGNSNVVSIPADIAKKVNIKVGEKIVLQVAADGKSVIMSKEGDETPRSSVTPDFIKILERVNKRYGQALKKLANQQ